MTKSRTQTFTKRMANAIRSFNPFAAPKLHIRERKRKSGAYLQVVQGRKIVRQFSALTTTLAEVRAAYPRATLSSSLAKWNEVNDDRP